MKFPSIFLALSGMAALVLLSGCGAAPKRTAGQPNPAAHRPGNPGAVKVKVSLSKQQVYVMEGDRPLLVAATCVGLQNKPTPVGTFSVTRKEADKRSGSYGFYKSGGAVKPAEAGHGSGEYVGYPMPFWVEFKPEYGFHQGYVWPIPHTHGCLRLHPNVAPKFYELVHVGTPVIIARSLPEDSTIGKNVPRPSDFNDPDPAPAYMISSKVFAKPAGSLLQ